MELHAHKSCHLPSGTPRLTLGAPMTAPLGTLFALGDTDGYAMTPRSFKLLFGRGEGEVHVPVGLGDQKVSRLQGELICDGQSWRVRNTGRLPLHSPGRPMLLRGHDVLLQPGYTPLVISTSPTRAHLLEILITGAVDGGDCTPTSPTAESFVYDLDETDILVLVALAQRYLLQERNPQPATWKQVADLLNHAPGGREWTPKAVECRVSLIRRRLATGTNAIRGILRDDEASEPIGNSLNHNLIQALLAGGTLSPEQLRLLEEV
ncbi:FHA domain-containing protein [Catenulispora pinisilvae]|uniref:FHA domain-containing protein n=1 Tax=Catenulispora pinisilvae TaxID=2705253 RepID=UPI001891EDA1|nr:FHA domain-containing protein [Catenulispora pinisilvae]